MSSTRTIRLIKRKEAEPSMKQVVEDDEHFDVLVYDGDVIIEVVEERSKSGRSKKKLKMKKGKKPKQVKKSKDKDKDKTSE